MHGKQQAAMLTAALAAATSAHVSMYQAWGTKHQQEQEGMKGHRKSTTTLSTTG
jgi:hypothetical protein